jgi:serine protease Do
MSIMPRLSLPIILLALFSTAPAFMVNAWADPPSDAIADVIAGVQSSVVRVIGVQPQKKPPSQRRTPRTAEAAELATAIGSGFVIDPSGLIATNRHVVANAVAVFVGTRDGGRFRADIVGMAGKADVALLRITGATLPAVSFGDSDKLRTGDTVIAIGSPLGFDSTATVGIVSAVNRDIQESPFDDYVQTDAAINHGNSGGPLFNLAGQVVGMNSILFAPGTYSGSAGLGFAISSNELSFVLERLEKYQEVRPGMLPLRTQAVTALMAAAIGTPGPGGALVAALEPSADQTQSAIQTGDVITSFDGKTITDPRDLARRAARAPIGSIVTVQLYRSGKMVSADVPILPAEPRARPSVPLAPPPKTLGVQFAAAHGGTMANGDGRAAGVTIEAIDPAGSAADSGLQKGDVVLRIQQQDVAAPYQALAALRSRELSRQPFAAVLIRRDKQQTWVPVALPN